MLGAVTETIGQPCLPQGTRLNISQSLCTWPHWPLRSGQGKTGREDGRCAGLLMPTDPHWTLKSQQWHSCSVVIHILGTLQQHLVLAKVTSEGCKELATPLSGSFCVPGSQFPCLLGTFSSYFQPHKQNLCAGLRFHHWDILLPHAMQKPRLQRDSTSTLSMHRLGSRDLAPLMSRQTEWQWHSRILTFLQSSQMFISDNSQKLLANTSAHFQRKTDTNTK